MEKKIKSINGMTFVSECTVNKEELRELIEELGVTGGTAGSGWSLTAITLFEQLLKSIAYVDANIGKAIGDALIEEFKKSPQDDDAGSGGEPGDEPGDEPEVTKYTITYSLSDSSVSNNITTVEENVSYETEIIPPEAGYIESVMIIMGDVDVTSSVLTDNVINIPQVTGNIIITVVTKTSDNLIDRSLLTDGETMPNGAVVEVGKYLVTPMIPIEAGKTYYCNVTRNINDNVSEWGQGVYLYDENGTYKSFSQSIANKPMGEMAPQELNTTGYVRIKLHVDYKDIIYFGESGVNI